MHIQTCIVTPFEQNARVLVNQDTVMFVDPGGEIDRLLDCVDLSGMTTVTVFLTHAHIDHAAGVMPLLTRLSEKGFSPTLYAHKDEEDMRNSLAVQGVIYQYPETLQDVREPDVYLIHGDTVDIGDVTGEVLFTPGHSPGHVSLFFPAFSGDVSGDYAMGTVSAPLLIAGDALFKGSIGRTDLPGGDHATLVRSIKDHLLPLPHDTIVLSGHGPETTIGEEVQHNPFLR